MLRFIDELKESWQEYYLEGDFMNNSVPQQVTSLLTHQITQISVFHQLMRDKPDFRLPPRAVSSLAKLAK